MNGKVAKRLRKIAAELELDPKTKYAWGGPLRRRPDVKGPTGEMVPGAPIPRPKVMVECVRRAYKEAKKLYLGKEMTGLSPPGENNVAPFRIRMVDSIKRQGKTT